MSISNGTHADGAPHEYVASRAYNLDGSRRRGFQLPALLLILGAFVLPLSVVLWYSLHGFVYGAISGSPTIANYTRIFSSAAYSWTLVRSIVFVAVVSAITTVVAFPMAYYVAIHVRANRRIVFLALVIVPYLSSYLAKVIAWLALLGDTGIINTALMSSGIISTPISVLGIGQPAIILTFVYLCSPLAFMTLYSTLERIDPDLFEATSDLGGRRWHIFWKVVLPLSRNGILTTFAFVFVAMFGDYVTPVLIGGTDGVLFVNLLVNQFGASMQWGFGSAMAIVMLFSSIVLFSGLRAVSGTVKGGEFTSRTVKPAALGLKVYVGAFVLFLYAPISLLLLFAVNASPAVGLPITGLSLKWFAAAFADQGFRESFQNSLIIATGSSLISTCFGTMASMSLAQSTGKRRTAVVAVLTAPMFMPPVILGIGILIACSAAGVDRGIWVLMVSHALLSMPVAILIMLARLEGMSGNQELAAMDLGATPWKTFVRVSLPQMMPALIAALVLTFAFSLDEFILTFLVTGRTSTLPIFIFSSIRFQLSPSAIAAASVVMLLSLSLIAVGAIAYNWRSLSRRGIEN
ncbi:ABC transporter permease subunit [Ochrobactrum sp. A-1]|uniref:ABC transporter permease subunit n=1 Tax=Ochrobactrum sp. A-1 TaxID=2920940 RepID=UPI001F0A61EF|nr:ABC transporter permease subunit [Ochrobactrum sp. A-1]